MKASEVLAGWVDEQAKCLTEERQALYHERKAYNNSLFLEFPLGEVETELGSQWAEKIKTCLKHAETLAPLKRPMKIAEIPIAYDKVFDFTGIVLDVLPNDLFKNMLSWFFCAVADETGGSVFAVNTSTLAEPVSLMLNTHGTTLEECLKPGAIIEVRNAKSFPLRGVGALSFTRTSSMHLLGYDMLPHVMNFTHRHGTKSI